MKKSSRHALRRFYPAAIALLLTASFLIAGCKTENKNEPASGNTNTSNEQKNAVVSKKPKVEGKGAFKAEYPPVNNPRYAIAQEEVKKTHLLEQIAASLNEAIAIPVDVTLSLRECGEENAFYNPDTKRVEMCYELVEHFYNIFKPDARSQEELDQDVFGASAFVFAHELGHALIDVLDLPSTGKEEDAVDQLAMLVLADGSKEGESAVINGAKSFMLEERQGDTDLDRLAFWDEHSLSQQRFYNLICWLYGHDQEKYSGLVGEQVLPESRAVRCPEEYTKIAKSWNKLLAPYLKK
ncbi:MAG TPA: DUF4344 domain-containing metallopeptidase [Blastocatellia bacterium]|nr:DUF4344 domain-containing metallopeptidase [Blastocatellia bacterium]